MQLSVVTTMYRSAPYVREFCLRAAAAARSLGVSFEIVLVNDGSPDDSLAVAIAAQAEFPEVVVVDLSRNFGHHKAIVAGLAHSTGDRVFLLDVDLEDSPEWLADFAREMDAHGSDVVFGVQKARAGGALRRWSGALFYGVFNALSHTRIPSNLCTVRLMTRAYVDALVALRDQNLFLAGNAAWVGFDQRSIPVEKKPRAQTSYSLRRRIQLGWEGLTSYSGRPLQFVFAVGILISAVSGAVGLYYLVRRMLSPGEILSGFTSVILSIWFLGGLIILFLGVVGSYVGKVFDEVKDRPQYVVRRVHRKEPK